MPIPAKRAAETNRTDRPTMSGRRAAAGRSHDSHPSPTGPMANRMSPPIPGSDQGPDAAPKTSRPCEPAKIVEGHRQEQRSGDHRGDACHADRPARAPVARKESPDRDADGSDDERDRCGGVERGDHRLERSEQDELAGP